MSELVGGKSRWTLPSDPVTSAARRLQFDIGSRIPMRLGVFLGGTGENRISDINAARRLLFVVRSRISFWLGVWVCYWMSDISAARRLLFII